MRLLIQSRSFLPNVGGLEQATLLLARELTARGHEVVVATDVAPADNADAPILPFEVVRRRSFRELVALARKFDLVHLSGHSLPGISIAVVARRPLVVTHHGYQAACLEGLGLHGDTPCGFDIGRCAWLTAASRGPARAARQLVRHALARATLDIPAVHVAVSGYVARIVAAPRTVVVHNCADTTTFRPERGMGDAHNLLFVGRLVTEKGVQVLLYALALAARDGARLSLDIVGSGPIEGDLRQLVLKLGLEDQVRFLGVLRAEALAQRMHASAAVLVPSRYHETFGIVAAEALACGRIALVADRGGLPEIVENLGTVVPAEDASAWATMMRRAVEDRCWREATERSAIERSKHFSPSRYADGYLQAYRRALELG